MKPWAMDLDRHVPPEVGTCAFIGPENHLVLTIGILKTVTSVLGVPRIAQIGQFLVASAF